MFGDAGYRSPYLSHAKRALYHLSYIPLLQTQFEMKHLNPLSQEIERSPSLAINRQKDTESISNLRQLSWQSGGLQTVLSKQTSIGRWFKSGSKELFLLLFLVFFLNKRKPRHKELASTLFISLPITTIPRQSSGEDLRLSRGRPGFDSRSGRISIFYFLHVNPPFLCFVIV